MTMIITIRPEEEICNIGNIAKFILDYDSGESTVSIDELFEKAVDSYIYEVIDIGYYQDSLQVIWELWLVDDFADMDAFRDEPPKNLRQLARAGLDDWIREHEAEIKEQVREEIKKVNEQIAQEAMEDIKKLAQFARTTAKKGE